MTTFTVGIDDSKTEKTDKAFLDALEIKYNVNHSETKSKKVLSKKEREIYDGLKESLREIKRWENGEIELKDARDLMNEL